MADGGGGDRPGFAEREGIDLELVNVRWRSAVSRDAVELQVIRYVGNSEPPSAAMRVPDIIRPTAYGGNRLGRQMFSKGYLPETGSMPRRQPSRESSVQRIGRLNHTEARAPVRPLFAPRMKAQGRLPNSRVRCSSHDPGSPCASRIGVPSNHARSA